MIFDGTEDEVTQREVMFMSRPSMLFAGFVLSALAVATGCTHEEQNEVVSPNAVQIVSAADADRPATRSTTTATAPLEGTSAPPQANVLDQLAGVLGTLGLSSPDAATAAMDASANHPELASALEAKFLPAQRREAAGAQPASPEIGGNLREGESAEVGVELAANGAKCYTAVAVAAESVQSIVVELIAIPPAPLPRSTVAESAAAPLQTTLGGGSACYRNMLSVPLPALVKITAQKGAGAVLGELFSK